MSKALVFSDLHLHDHKDSVDRLQNCLDVLNWIFDQAEQNGCEYMFFLGDLFQERSKIDVRNYLRTFEVFSNRTKNSNLKVFLLVGNHDMYRKESWEITSVKPLSVIPNVEVIDKPTQMVLGGKKIDWMPHTDNPIRDLEQMKEDNGGAGDILLAHLAVHGSVLNMVYGTKSDVIAEHDNDMIPVDVEIFNDWFLTLLGHYHGAQNLNYKVEYVGSPLQLSFGEAFQDKHVIVLDLETLDKKYIKNDFSPKHIMAHVKDIEKEKYDLNGNFVRIITESIHSQEFSDARRKVLDEYKVLTLDSKPVEKKVKNEIDIAAIENAKAEIMDTSQMMTRFLETKGVPKGMDKDKLMLFGKRCLETES